MLSPASCQLISESARKFHVKTVWLFGTALRDGENARDIDLAVEGLDPVLFFKFYAEVYFGLPKPVDLVDLSQDPPLAPLIRSTGVRIYES